MNILEIKKQLIKSLSNQDLTELTIALSQHLETVLEVGNVIDEFTDKRFADGLVCPHCHKDNTVKNGRVRGKQRYYCKDCKRTFNAYTKTVLANTKKSLSLWVKYADCMSRQMTLRATAQELDISLSTSFYMRHKILTALRNYMGVDDLSGIIEMDETFFAESFKGNHKLHNQVWTAPRNSRKSRHRGKEVKYRGISRYTKCKDLIYNSSSAIMELTREDIKCLSPFADFRENKEVSL